MRTGVVESRARTVGVFVLVGGVLLIAGSALGLALTGNAGVRFTADTDETIPMWNRWIPVVVGLLLVRLLPAPATGVRSQRPSRLEAGVLLGSAVLFAVALRLAGGGEPAHILLKLALLLGVPLAMFWYAKRTGATWRVPTAESIGWAPAVPVAAWLVLSYAGPWALPASDLATTLDLGTLIAALVVGCLANALLEEIFYRRWLQSRWEAILGRWPAIVLSSVLWAGWHIAIQGTGDLPKDLASAFVNQGVLGLLLGYLWSKYRVLWPICTIHGAANAVPVLLSL
ncbi:CPBP family intramembrane glutamic endopeptidase [Kribbella hippodromi]